MARGRPSSRERILEAAAGLAREVGPGHLVLDAVAKRAGVSKGGLLYHFPTKVDLIQALVSHHVERFERGLADRQGGSGPASGTLLRACIDLFELEMKEPMPPASGFLAALAENPDLLAPARAMTRRLLDRICGEEGDNPEALVLFMALQGLQCLPMLGLDVLTERERTRILAALRRMAEADG